MERPAWLGKLVGGAIGFILLGGLFGLLLGLFIGHMVDSAHRIRSLIDPALQRTQGAFFETTFTLMGRLAKCDGHISEQEIGVAEQLMSRMNLGAAHREEAIAHFKRGATAAFDVEAQLDAFVGTANTHPNLKQMLLVFLLSTALADGAVSTPERELLEHIALRIGIPAAHFAQIFAMFSAQQRFHEAPGAPPSRHSLEDAYTALGIDAATNDKDAKLAYRRLMSQYHPDKLIAEGMPADMVKIATERTQEIQNAWEQVRKARGI